MCRVNFLASRRLVSGFLTMMKPVRLHKSVWRKNECSCFCFRGGAIRRPESRRNSRAGVTSSRKDGPVRCRRAKAFFSWLQFAARKRISRPTFQNRRVGECQGGELNSRPRAYESPALPLSYPGDEFLLAELPAVLNNGSPTDSDVNCRRGLPAGLDGLIPH